MTLVADTNVLAELFLPARQSSEVLLKYMRADLLETTKALAIWQKALGRLAPLERSVDGQEVLALALRRQCSSSFLMWRCNQAHSFGSHAPSGAQPR